MSSAHQSMVNRILLELSEAGCLAFPNQTGRAWAGQIVHQQPDMITLRNPRMIKYGLCVGSSDIVAGLPMIITQELVGSRFLRFVAPEVKTGKAVPDKNQRNFRDQILQAGGIAGIVRSPEDALALIRSSA